MKNVEAIKKAQYKKREEYKKILIHIVTNENLAKYIINHDDFVFMLNRNIQREERSVRIGISMMKRIVFSERENIGFGILDFIREICFEEKTGIFKTRSYQSKFTEYDLETLISDISSFDIVGYNTLAKEVIEETNFIKVINSIISHKGYSAVMHYIDNSKDIKSFSVVLEIFW